MNAILPFVPVKVDSPAPDDRPRLVDVVHLNDAVEIPDPPRPTAGSQPAAGKEMKVEQAAQSNAAVFGHHLRLVFDEI